ncbi:hypothetical protein [Nocardia sp. NPDC051463]|uniref:hypothetical protein n=1 Tax=Nocardia sp. NPDC051463 TaxID=3154845 RepID=UPI003450FB26
MKFLVDAQLPAKLAALLKVTGHDDVHMLQLFTDHLDDVVTLLSQSAVVELGRDRLVAHTDRDPSDER